jgi:SAM-dependent methyltransferase
VADGSGSETFRTSPEAYDKHVGRYGRALAEALVTAAGVKSGDRAVDVGCGPGALTQVLAERLGAEHVAAVDPSEPYATACASRVPGADVRVAPAEQLPFDTGSRDAALAQLVVNFMSDAAQGVGEMGRVVRPGGVVAACVWDYAGRMTLLRAFWDAAVGLGLPEAEERDEGRIMRYCQPGELGDLWRASGLSEVEVTGLVVTADYESFDSLWEPFERGVAPSGAFAQALPPSEREQLRAEYHRRLGEPEPEFQLSARAWCAVGRK